MELSMSTFEEDACIALSSIHVFPDAAMQYAVHKYQGCTPVTVHLCTQYMHAACSNPHRPSSRIEKYFDVLCCECDYSYNLFFYRL